VPGPAFGQAASAQPPTVDDLLNVKTVGSPQLSPDGAFVGYTVSSTDWKQDAFVTQAWLIHVPSGRTFQATRGEKSCSSPAWFNHYIFGDPLPDCTKPELPKEK
jgi:hypothetical protein